MEKVYLCEHEECYNYQNTERPAIDLRLRKEGEKWTIQAYADEIVFVIDGHLQLFYKGISPQSVHYGHFVLIPSGTRVRAIAPCDVSMVVLRFQMQANMCEFFQLHKTPKTATGASDELPTLPVRQSLRNFLESLTLHLNDGIQCIHFFQLKLREIFILLRFYYTREELSAFFLPLLQDESGFADAVINHYREVKTLEELAAALNYSLSGFEKRFRKVFGISAGRWIKEQRTREILHEITRTNKTFKEISNQFGFYSSAHLTVFCKTTFGVPPGDLRKRSRGA